MRPISQKSGFRKSKMADGFNLEFRFWFIIWTSIKIFGIVMDSQQPKTTCGSIMRFSTIQHARHLESHHVRITQLRIEILHILGYWYLEGKLCPGDGMFKLAIRNKFNTTAATVLHFVFGCIIHPPMTTFHRKFHIVAENRYPKVIHMSKLIFYVARRRMAAMLNLVFQQALSPDNFVRQIFTIKQQI